MAVLRTIESKIEGLFEGVFGRAFRSHVQPIELARKLVKEMDDHRSVSVSKVYVPNEYTVYLSPDDRKQFEGYEEALVGELQEYLAEHARREKYALLDTPRVLVEIDDDLAVGEFGIATRLVAGEGHRSPSFRRRSRSTQPAQTMIYKAPAAVGPVAPDTPLPEPRARGRHADGRGPEARGHEGERRPRSLAGSRRARVRRQRLASPRRAPSGRRRLLDRRPGSTNGVEVNGKRVDRARVRDGDRIVLGSTEVVFGRSLPS